jgi:transaldolase/glucose-6-phosphate isomerase
MDPLASLGDFHLPSALRQELDRTLAAWRTSGNVRRLWARDATLWTGADEEKWLGWLDFAAQAARDAGELRRLADAVRGEGFAHALLLGMGGSSLGAEVIAGTFGRQSGYPALIVLDSTDPAQIRGVERQIDPARTLYVVSSKSGTTLETDILMQYFLTHATNAIGADKAAAHFIAITDPGSKLHAAAARFRAVFLGEPSIGGRYSVLSVFGLVPAAIVGVDVAWFIEAAERMARACAADIAPQDNPGVSLGLLLGLAAQSGRDKVTISTSPALADFGTWLEQLLAESTGKQGRGLVPVDGEPVGAPDCYGPDRIFVHLSLADEDDAAGREQMAALARAGHPSVRFVLADRYALGAEFFRWQVATAVAGAVLGVNPFDQPDVEASKVETRVLTDAAAKTGGLPHETPLFEAEGIRLFADLRNEAALESTVREPTFAGWIAAHLARAGEGDYVALLAYIARDARHAARLKDMRTLIRDRLHVATCVGFGPRFLHSTGQAYKGGPNSGVFLQITCDAAEELPVPGRAYGFGLVEAAQARGDFHVLAERGRRALRVHLGTDVDAGLARLEAAIRGALG